MSKTVLLEVKNGIGYITINRPEALNALSSQVLADLNEVLDQVEKSEEIRVVIVTGAGEKAFVAGADIKEMDLMSPIQAFEYMTFANDTFTRLSDLRQPTISVLNGYALGGGMELALSTDIRIGFEKTVVGFPEVGLGIIPGFAGTQRMSRLIGTSRAKELIFTARTVKGQEAYELGILNKLVSAEELLTSAEELATAMMKNAPIMILDEATSSSDPENEASIQESLSAAARGKTLIVIAHRLMTVKNADQIAYIEDGRIKKMGRHEELMESCDDYRMMWELSEEDHNSIAGGLK